MKKFFYYSCLTNTDLIGIFYYGMALGPVLPCDLIVKDSVVPKVPGIVYNSTAGNLRVIFIKNEKKIQEKVIAYLLTQKTSVSVIYVWYFLSWVSYDVLMNLSFNNIQNNLVTVNFIKHFFKYLFFFIFFNFFYFYFFIFNNLKNDNILPVDTQST